MIRNPTQQYVITEKQVAELVELAENQIPPGIQIGELFRSRKLPASTAAPINVDWETDLYEVRFNEAGFPTRESINKLRYAAAAQARAEVLKEL